MTSHETTPAAAAEWQSALDPGLVQRLMRPLVRPGVVGPEPARSILRRAQGMGSHLPLLDRVTVRYGTRSLASEGAPIVLARRLSAEPDPAGPAAGAPQPAPTVSRPVVNVPARLAATPGSAVLQRKPVVSGSLVSAIGSTPAPPNEPRTGTESPVRGEAVVVRARRLSPDMAGAARSAQPDAAAQSPAPATVGTGSVASLQRSQDSGAPTGLPSPRGSPSAAPGAAASLSASDGDPVRVQRARGERLAPAIPVVAPTERQVAQESLTLPVAAADVRRADSSAATLREWRTRAAEGGVAASRAPTPASMIQRKPLDGPPLDTPTPPHRGAGAEAASSLPVSGGVRVAKPAAAPGALPVRVQRAAVSAGARVLPSLSPQAPRPPGEGTRPHRGVAPGSAAASGGAVPPGASLLQRMPLVPRAAEPVARVQRAGENAPAAPVAAPPSAELPAATAEEAAPPTDVARVADQVYEILVSRLASERRQRGW
jgi:hypothetical protein